MTDSTATLAAESPDMTTVLGSIHNDETQLRTLVVVLSLTGGLVLAFALGFGIYLYWHCCARSQGREHWAEKDVYSQSISINDDACCVMDSVTSQQDKYSYDTVPMTTAAGSCHNDVPPTTTPSSFSTTSYHDEDDDDEENEHDEELLNAAGALAPSAPSAKEILIGQNEQRQQQQTWCHYHMLIEPPPPAYTPSFRRH